jgi:uncharacterized repeat protein (TIGR01451 family)
VTYTLTVHSDGPGTVDVFAGDLLPPQLLKPPTALEISGGTGVCRFDPTGESLGAPPGSDFPIIACDIPQFGPNEDRVITYTATLAPDSAGSPVTNRATAGAVVPFTDLLWDPDNFEDNVDEATFTPGTVDLGIAKSVLGSSTVAVGEVATFRLVASNSGTVAAQNVVVTDTLPAGLEPVELPAGCTAAGQVVSCAVGTLGPDADQTIDLRARAGTAAAGSTVTNRASIRADEAASSGRTTAAWPTSRSGRCPHRRNRRLRRRSIWRSASNLRPVSPLWASPAPGRCASSTTGRGRPPTSRSTGWHAEATGWSERP